MNNTPYIEMLVEPINGLLAVRKSNKDAKNSVFWMTMGKKGNYPKNISGKAFLKTIFEIFSWNTNYKYRLRGVIMNNEEDEPAIIFNLFEPEVLIPKNIICDTEDSSKSKTVCAYPEEWSDNFRNEYYTHLRSGLSGTLSINEKDETFINEQAHITDNPLSTKDVKINTSANSVFIGICGFCQKLK